MSSTTVLVENDLRSAGAPRCRERLFRGCISVRVSSKKTIATLYLRKSVRRQILCRDMLTIHCRQQW